MLYDIASDIPGRLSVRVRANLLTADEARGVSVALMRVDGVEFAEAHEASGRILVVHKPGARKRVGKALDELDVLDLPSLPADSIEVPHELEVALEDNRFMLEASGLVFWHFARRLLLPAPVRAAYTVFQAARFIWRGLKLLAQGRLTVDVLDATAIAASLLRGSFNDASSVMLLLNLTAALESHVQKRVRIAMAENLITRPEAVWALDESTGEFTQIPMSAVTESQVLRLCAGQVLPVDGTVEAGAAELNEASMTGEAALVRKEAGSTVFAGTALESGELHVRVTAAPGKARIDEIARMVEESSGRKAAVQADAEHLSDALVPASFAAFFGILAVTRSLATAMTVLMVDYSCAVRLATPISVMAAMGEATRRDIVVKGGKYLEALAAADTVVFDKTGTLTCANPTVERVLTFGELDEDEVLRYAACIEEHFPHSVARAIVEAADARGLTHDSELHADVDYIVAHGIKTEVNGHAACIGSYHFVFEDEKVKKPRALRKTVEREMPASSVIYLAIDGKLEGAIGVSDPLRPEAGDVLQQLRELGIDHIAMLTGDSELAARTVADELGIDEYHSQVLPEHKSDYVRRLRDEGRTVVMVGDGINDSPALATANVSVALADASDVARAVADISVLDASLEKLVTMRQLSTALMRRIRADYRFIVAFNTALIALGVSGTISVTAAAYLHNASTLAISAASTRPYLPEDKGTGRLSH